MSPSIRRALSLSTLAVAGFAVIATSQYVETLDAVAQFEGASFTLNDAEPTRSTHLTVALNALPTRQFEVSTRVNLVGSACPDLEDGGIGGCGPDAGEFLLLVSVDGVDGGMVNSRSIDGLVKGFVDLPGCPPLGPCSSGISVQFERGADAGIVEVARWQANASARFFESIPDGGTLTISSP